MWWLTSNTTYIYGGWHHIYVVVGHRIYVVVGNHHIYVEVNHNIYVVVVNDHKYFCQPTIICGGMAYQHTHAVVWHTTTHMWWLAITYM